MTVTGKLGILDNWFVSEVTHANDVYVAPSAGIMQGYGPTSTWLLAATVSNPKPLM